MVFILAAQTSIYLGSNAIKEILSAKIGVALC